MSSQFVITSCTARVSPVSLECAKIVCRPAPMLATCATRLLLISILVRTAYSDDFICSVDITGSSAYAEDIAYANATVDCISKQNDGRKLPLLMHDSLEPHYKSMTGTRSCQQMLFRQQHLLHDLLFHVAGVEARFSNETFALLTIDSTVGLTFHLSQLKSINSTYFDSLISIQTGSSVLFDQLVSTSCNTYSNLLNVICEPQHSSVVAVHSSSFSMYQNTAIYIDSCFNVSIKGSNFTGLAIAETEPDFTASVSQAVMIQNSSTATLEACRFADMSGGAMYVYSRNTTTVEDCLFSNNTNFFRPYGSGGAIFSNSQRLLVDHCDFVGNIATGGGAIYVQRGNVTINSSFFRDNAACPGNQAGTSHGGVADYAANGGAINYYYNSRAHDGRLHHLHVFNSTFLQNFAWDAAGAIYSWQLPGTVYIEQCSLARNGDHDLASDVYVFGRGTKLIVVGSSFTNSLRSAGPASIYGNHLQCLGLYSTNFSNSVFGALHARNVGGRCDPIGDLFNKTRISSDATSAVVIEKFLGNDADYIFSVDIRYCRFDNISQKSVVKIEGGLDSRIVVTQSTFVGTSSTIALWTIACSHVVVWDSVFRNNSGGAIVSHANSGGGMLIGNCSFINNTAVNGGAVSGDTGGRFFITSNSRFIMNRASGKGGAIYSDGPQLFLENGTTLLHNHATEGGGGIFCSKCDEYVLRKAHVESNRSAFLQLCCSW